MRLDLAVAEKFSLSRSKAVRLIERGEVRVGGEIRLKAAFEVKAGDLIELEKLPEYASFGGEKLAKALKDFDFSVKDMVCADLGASNGGFTSCLIKNGAKKVYAVDVGECALPPELKSDERVVVKDKTNARYLKREDIGEECDLVVIDVSFISLALILPAAKEILKSSGYIIALIKPQFEVGKKALGKSGIVTNAKEREKSIEKIRDCAKALDLVERDLTSAPQRQNKNIEFLILLSKK